LKYRNRLRVSTPNVALATLLVIAAGRQAAGSDAPFFEKGVIAEADKPYYRNYIPNVARLADGKLLAVWGASGRSGETDSRIMGSLSSDSGKTWSSAAQILSQPKAWNGDASIVVDGKKTMVFVTVVENPRLIEKLEIWKTTSMDFGKTWSNPVLVPMPHKYSDSKTHAGLKLRDGTLLLPYSWDIWIEEGMIPKTEGEMNLKASALISRDHGETWQAGGDVHVEAPRTSPFSTGGACEPGIVQLASGELYMLVRTSTTNAWESRSRDGGKTWTPAKPSALTAHNTPVALWRLDNSPEIVAAWNNSPRYRWPLTVALSKNEGRSWSTPRELANTPKIKTSYPSITQANDGNIVVVWQQELPEKMGRDIRFARFNRAWLVAQ